MLDPFQCLHYCALRDSNKADILLAACGSRILSFNVSNGALLSIWPSIGNVEAKDKVLQSNAETLRKNEVNNGIEEESALGDKDAERPGKRRKLSTPGSGSESASTEIVVKEHEGTTNNAASIPAVTKLTGSSNCRYVVTVTGEDKCIRVFELHDSGTLVEISKRYMPKRPCAIVFTTDDSTILCADKFGDVYSLPLLGRSSEKDPQTPGTGNTSINGDLETSHKPFVPAASTLTVHTRRNQQALKNQHKATNQPKTKRPLEFDHQLLLGHVSLLTDLAYVTLSASGSSQGMDRSYILTSDRDEHIRVSRGLLQAHVIECYCLGHTEFVSKLCIPRWQPQLLVSGGGDDYLLLWDWVSGTARLRVDLKGPVEEFRESYKSSSSYAQNPVLEGRVEKIAVSGIWSMGHLETTAENIQGEIIVACEGMPALFFYSLDSDGSLAFRQCLLVAGNVLDVVVIEGRSTIMYSMDNIHEKCSTNILDKGPPRPSLGAVTFSVSAQSWDKEVNIEGIIASMDQETLAQDEVLQEGGSKATALSELLYGLENLRKRGQEE